MSNSPIFREVGISGLYNVINVEHKINANGFETTFKCYNEASIDWDTAIKNLAKQHKKGLKSKKLKQSGTQRKKKARAKNAATNTPEPSTPALDPIVAQVARENRLTADQAATLQAELIENGTLKKTGGFNYDN